MDSFSYLEPVCCSMFSSNCCFLTFIQVSQEAGHVIWYSHVFQNFPQFIVIHTVKGFGIVNKAEIDVFLELSCFFNDPADVGNLISGCSAFSKTSLNIWKFTVYVMLKPDLENFEYYFTRVWDWRRQWHPTPVLLLGKSHGQKSLVGYSSWGREELDMTERLHFHFSLSCVGEGNGNPLQCSCLENPRDRGAWWAAIYRVAQSRTRLKRLSSSSRVWDRRT